MATRAARARDSAHQAQSSVSFATLKMASRALARMLFVCIAIAPAVGAAPLPLTLRGGGVKLVSTWAGDLGDMAAGAAVGSAAGYIVGSTVKSSVSLAEAVYTQTVIIMMLNRLGLVKVEWVSVRTLVARIAGLPILSVRLLVTRHMDEKRRRKEAELDRINHAAYSEGPRSDAARHPFNEHAAIGSLCAFAAGVSLSSDVGVGDHWRRMRGGAYLPTARFPCR